ncbi:MAG: peroxidase-related enzyme [Flavobacteriaceae bacterium]|nr:peroxidase-related enzyme [Bacteroidia bacterium]NNF73879.1 peroxidase-related enzyme [Flavobacteriaceae bacterium]NNK74277.1 peroxidase-related enzyme [Flavobacteriaceae bacterium]
MSWITVIPYNISTGKLRMIYDRIRGKNGQIDNVLSVHSLRPHTLVGHINLYKNVLHHKDNSVPQWFLECLGVWTSILNECDYCIKHHFEGMKRLLNNDLLAERLLKTLKAGDLRSVGLKEVEIQALEYARTLTLTPGDLTEEHVNIIKKLGYTDGEILEVNQVVAYFNYANRTVLGLGVNTKGEVLGLSPNDSDDEESWTHR